MISKGNVVGEARKGDPVDPCHRDAIAKAGAAETGHHQDGLWSLRASSRSKAFNPITMTAYASITLETDYAV